MRFFKKRGPVPEIEVDDPDHKKKLAAYSTLGIMFPASIAIGLFIGVVLDDLLGTDPVLTIIFTLYGLAAGFYNFFKIINKYEKRK
ncbi:MAG: AtpZ/AtpI family protein [Candidatus Aminicenantes bacterium]|nr:AtpZ/AtpI family protein [Candidatus Aminicenantes bacterium]MCK5221401.1 AtpZ/AtpI family protein [Candidatus Aminicenantes bacterium]